MGERKKDELKTYVFDPKYTIFTRPGEVTLNVKSGSLGTSVDLVRYPYWEGNRGGDSLFLPYRLGM